MAIKPVSLFLSLSLVLSAAVAEDIQLAKLSNGDNKFVSPAAPSVTDLSSVFSELDKRLSVYPKDHEAELLKSILYFRSGKLDQALAELDKLIKKVPDFQLAYLLKGDMLLSKFGNTNNLGQTNILASIIPQLGNSQKQQLNFLREEAQLRIRALLDNKKSNTLPRQILALGKSVKKALLVDKKANRMYVFSRQASGELFEEVNDYYITTGKLVGDKATTGDLRTPEGVYFVTSWISPDKLPDKYGIGAFPVNYPNELDRRNGKTGFGIWLHGTDKGSYSRPPRDSEGCVVLTNIDLQALKSEIIPGLTPVVITDKVEWIDYASWQKERQEIIQAIEDWRIDWESMNVNKYLSHYGQDFWSSSHNLKSWSARKRFLANNKTYQSVKFSDLSVLVYPKKEKDEQQIAVVRLQQDYKSNNFNSEMYKRLYLTKKDKDWKILYEGR
ncbi:MAG: L,D-transpeptidase family protein [Gammaproteobacteria bacterium]|nr:L,D-transpeptidase family protein [Gammaproteobacteria bacterium]MCW8987322.1 L,D-transpeptidase family protein [Gammaproteobacteria bacterium]MCW9030314.1 L,D-transpeptidase family protein [Gammaproteobacteria bacterium]